MHLNGHLRRWRYAFMPHVTHANSVWETICREIGCGYIDPRRPVEEVLAAIGETKLLLTEALHGAVVADALRVPWVPVRTGQDVLAFKWEDWCRSLGMTYAPHDLPPMLMPVWPYRRHPGLVAPVRHWAKVRLVGAALQRLAREVRPMLSDPMCLEHATARLEEALGCLRRDLAAGRFAGGQWGASRPEERHG
jgi:succinoglycan biosynthesis protein ExoV